MTSFAYRILACSETTVLYFVGGLMGSSVAEYKLTKWNHKIAECQSWNWISEFNLLLLQMRKWWELPITNCYSMSSSLAIFSHKIIEF